MGSGAASVAICAVLLAVGCGGGSGRAGTPARPPGASSTGSATPPVTGEPSGATGPPESVPPAPGPPASRSPARPSDGGGALAVHIPAALRVTAGHAVPATVSIPAHLAVELELRSGDGRPHRAQLHAPGSAPLSVPAGGRAVQRIAGLRPGRYVLMVDGLPSAALYVGGEPGP